MSDPYDDADRKTMSELYDEIERLQARVDEFEAVIKTLYKETSDNWVQQHIQECGLANSGREQE